MSQKNKTGKSPDRRPSRVGAPARAIQNRARRIVKSAHGGKMPEPMAGSRLIAEATVKDRRARLHLSGRKATKS